MAYNFKDTEEVKLFLKNLETEYKFLCLHEKNPEGCHLLGDYLETIKHNAVEAGKLYKANCDDHNFGKSCLTFGNYSYLGKGCEENVEKALDYYKRACELNEDRACLHSGVLLTNENDKNVVIEKDFVQGVKYLEKGCSLGNAESCFFVSGLYLKGAVNIPKDLRKAFEVSTKACELGSMYACKNLCTMYRNGDGVSKDDKMAKFYENKFKDLKNDLNKKRGIEFQMYT